MRAGAPGRATEGRPGGPAARVSLVRAGRAGLKARNRLLRVQPRDDSAAAPFRKEVGISQTAVLEKSADRFAWNTVLFAVAALALIAAIAVAVIFVPKSMQAWAVVESHQPFISTPDIERFPSFSPDGTMIAYARGKNAWSRQTFLQLRRGGDPLQLTHDEKLSDKTTFTKPCGTTPYVLPGRSLALMYSVPSDGSEYALACTKN
jgi:hypothetical protein